LFSVSYKEIKLFILTYKVQGRSIKFKVDTGAQVNILPSTIYGKLPRVKLMPTKTTLTSYSGDKLKEKYEIENFLKLDIVRSDVSNFIRIRISNSTLMIEKGRHRKINLANMDESYFIKQQFDF
jgi:hypothetical protein